MIQMIDVRLQPLRKQCPDEILAGLRRSVKQCPDHAGRYSTNAVIPRLVAEAIIDILEMVDVNHSKHQVSGMPTAENPVRFCEEVLVVQHPVRPSMCAMKW